MWHFTMPVARPSLRLRREQGKRKRLRGWQQSSPLFSATAGHTAWLCLQAQVWAVCFICSPWALFHLVSLWSHQIVVGGKPNDNAFNKGRRLNRFINTKNITENLITSNQVRAGVQLALHAASIWPKLFVLSSLSVRSLPVSPPAITNTFCLFLPWKGWDC